MLLLATSLGVAACGGPSRPTSQTVVGDGFSFKAPLSWRLSRDGSSIVASKGRVDLVEVVRYRLERPYRPALSAAAARELDGVVASLASQMHGRLASRSSVEIASTRAPDYHVVYGPGRTLEIAFFLRDQSEFELLCRRRTSEPDLNCAQLFSSFAPS